MNADGLFSGRDETVINASREDFAKVLGHGKISRVGVDTTKFILFKTQSKTCE